LAASTASYSRAAAAEKTVGRVAEDIERLEQFVARFRYKKSKAKQAQAKLTQIGRLEQERSRAAEELGFKGGQAKVKLEVQK